MRASVLLVVYSFPLFVRGPCFGKVLEFNLLLNTQKNVTIYKYPVVNPLAKQKMLAIHLGSKCRFFCIELA